MNTEESSFSDSTPAALITGASSGIGRVFALALAEEANRHIIISARRRELLETLKSEIEEKWKSSNSSTDSLKVFVFCCDLSLEKERCELLKRIGLEKLSVDLLINNAGFGSIGKFVESSLEWEDKMVEVNCKAPLHLTRHFLPLMIERYQEQGSTSSIVNVSSIASFQSVPYMATYAATKAFLTSLTLAIQAEVEKQGIQLLALCPGPTESEFYKVVGLKKKVELVPSMSAEAVVKQALESLENKKSIRVNGLKNVIMVQLNRLVPRMTSARIGERLLRPYLDRKI